MKGGSKTSNGLIRSLVVNTKMLIWQLFWKKKSGAIGAFLVSCIVLSTKVFFVIIKPLNIQNYGS